MASLFSIEHEVVNGMVRAAVFVASKGPADDALVRTYGDIIVRRSGIFADPNDATFPQFRVDAGDDCGVFLNALPGQKIEHFFDDAAIDITPRMRQASLWTSAIVAQITNQLTTLRLKTDVSGGNTTVTI